MIVVTCGLAHSYSAYGSAKRRTNNMVAPMMPVYSQLAPQYYDNRASTSYLQPQQMQYLSVPYMQQQQPVQQQQQQPRIADDYNYRSNPSYFYYPQQREYQEQQYGIPTYHGEYNPKPYYFARPSYITEDDRLETTNPLDYLHEEILEENERARNNAAFMQNLALYNKHVDSLQGRTQQMQQIQELYNLKPISEFDDYEMDQPTDWYDQTAILLDPSSYESYMPQQQQQQQQQQTQLTQNYQQTQPQYQYQQRPIDYDDEMVKELKELKQNRKNKGRSYEMPKQQMYSNQDWQQDMPSDGEDDDVMEPESYDDGWINWGGQKRSIQPKKDFGDVKQQQVNDKQPKPLKVTMRPLSVTTSKPSSSSTVSASTTTTSSIKSLTENSKLLGKLHKGQKEVVLPRPATPVRRPFSESIMKSLGNKFDDKQSSSEQAAPIYKTIKQIIDMEQNLSHVSISIP
jgi:hypothetical protein